ncbi:surface protease GP63 [Trypanosoma cruzi Dm28c]|uniref:Surface protease GP63 n=1 Tax=Trypanosoma cruzi Dm28c TaxID=1416333 RepID=V5AJK2_TRYCR|nr:surface protease GP63 [Trypanosoma cruzi Dm28c]
MDSRPHITPRSTHIMCPLYICMHAHAGPLVLSFARHAPLPSCLAAWAEHRNCFCFYCIEWATSLSPSVCVFCFTGVMRVCVRWSSHASAFCFFVLFSFLILWLSAPIPPAACV